MQYKNVWTAEVQCANCNTTQLYIFAVISLAEWKEHCETNLHKNTENEYLSPTPYKT